MIALVALVVLFAGMAAKLGFLHRQTKSAESQLTVSRSPSTDAVISRQKPNTSGPSNPTSLVSPNAKRLSQRNPAISPSVETWLNEMNRPEVQNDLAAQARARTLLRYGDFLKSAKLSDQQIEALVKFMDDKRRVVTDLAVASFQNGIDPRDDLGAFRLRIETERTKIEQEIRTYLGDAVYQDYQSYDQQKYRMESFTRLQRELNDKADALSPDQRAKLEQLLVSGDGRLSPATIASAGAFLSPAQTSALHRAFVAQQEIAVGRLLEWLPTTKE